MIERSNQTLAPFKISLVLWSEDRLYGLPTEVVSEPERDWLSTKVVEDHTLHVFMVDKVALEEGEINGLYLHTKYDKTFLIVGGTVFKTTLAHEVGHALGLQHDNTKNNVMSKDRKDEFAFFTEAQGQEMRQNVQNGW